MALLQVSERELVVFEQLVGGDAHLDRHASRAKLGRQVRGILRLSLRAASAAAACHGVSACRCAATRQQRRTSLRSASASAICCFTHFSCSFSCRRAPCSLYLSARSCCAFRYLASLSSSARWCCLRVRDHERGHAVKRACRPTRRWSGKRTSSSQTPASSSAACRPECGWRGPPPRCRAPPLPSAAAPPAEVRRLRRPPHSEPGAAHRRAVRSRTSVRAVSFSLRCCSASQCFFSFSSSARRRPSARITASFARRQLRSPASK